MDRNNRFLFQWAIEVGKAVPIGFFPTQIGLELGCINAQNDKLACLVAVEAIGNLK
jgi:hypothetical protein